MPKVSGVVEELNQEDEKLRKEFEEFGETIKEKITDKNHPLLVKKLDHLRARRRMSENVRIFNQAYWCISQLFHSVIPVIMFHKFHSSLKMSDVIVIITINCRFYRAAWNADAV